jgi:hypothetical protein
MNERAREKEAVVKSATSAAAAGAVGAVGALGTGQTVNVALALGALATGVAGAELLVTLAIGAYRRRMELFGEAVQQAHATPAETVANQQTALAAVRALLDAADDAVAPALGRLAAKYTKMGRPADRFFRGCARVLGDLSAAEFDALTVLVHAARSLSVDATSSWVELQMHEVRDLSDEEDVAELTVQFWNEKKDGGGYFRERTQFSSSGGMRLFQLLKMHGLGRDNAVMGDEEVGPHVVVIERTDLDALLEVLASAT